MGYEIPNVLARGATPGGCPGATIGTWLRLSISFNGNRVAASINGTRVVSHVDSNSTYTAGLAAVGSGWHLAAFDDFHAEATIISSTS